MAVPIPALELSRSVGRNIRFARQHMNLTLSELSARTEVIGFRLSDHVISKIELGAKVVTVYDLFVIAQALEVSADLILKGEFVNESATTLRAVRHRVPRNAL